MEEEQEQAEEARSVGNEIDIIQRENDGLKRELKTAAEKTTGLEQVIAEKDGEIAAVKKSLEEAAGEIVEKGITLKEAVAAYKELAGQANPGLVAEMIKGDTIEEINASLKNARELVERVKREMGAEDARVRVPAGAPQRTLPDLSALTAREKIKYGIESPGT